MSTAETSTATTSPTLSTYELYMLSLCLFAIAAMAVDVTLPLHRDGKVILGWADNAVCALFLLDFLVSLVRSPNRLHYLRTWGWIDLLSSIPSIGILRIGRGARIVRILRVIEAFARPSSSFH